LFEDHCKNKKEKVGKNHDFIKKFTVMTPIKRDFMGNIYMYNVTGIDSQGEFSEWRKYTDFIKFSEVLKERWPGIYIPQA
jgi:hypothetical protein